MKIAVDIDDTLSTVQRAKLAEAYIKRNSLPCRITDRYTHSIFEVADWSREQALAFLQDGGIVLYTDAEVRKGAAQTLADWHARGYEITILTARPKAIFTNPERISRDWLQKRRLVYDKLVAECEEKGRYCEEHGIDVLVDDSVDRCIDAQDHNVAAVLASGMHCMDRLSQVRYSASDWAGIARCVEEIARRKGIL